jgi:hypothetical protein
MTYKLKYEHPQFPTGDDGIEFGISGLGRVINGGTLDVDEDMEYSFVASRGMTLEDAFNDSPEVTLTGNTSLSDEVVKQLVPAPEVEEGSDDSSPTTVQESVKPEAPTEVIDSKAVSNDA